MTHKNRLAHAFAIAGLAALGTTSAAFGQGCVAAHSSARVMDQLVPGYNPPEGGTKFSIHNLTFSIGYRVFNSNKYFVGTEEIARPTAVRNHQNIFDLDVNYQLSPRWSLVADVPFFDGTRNQIYPPQGVFQVGGIGDMTVGAQAWVFRPPTERGGDVAFSASLKIPTGINNATGSALYQGQTVKATADQSLQPGDGGWGFLLASQAYQKLWRTANAYWQGQYLFNPEDTNGVPTFRSQPGQGVMSVTDQYLFRAGLSQGVPVPKIRQHIVLSLGVRDEGVPAHDAIGKSDGFRRPGYIVSIDPGLMYSYHRDTLAINGPWALARNREPSVPELQNGTKNGDAFFADYTIIASWSHQF